MNSHVAPLRDAQPSPAQAANPGSAALVTASYRLDFERCRLLCDTVDRHATGVAHHYILVEGRDVKLFRQLEGAHRTVVDERDLLPSWLHAFNDPTGLFRRRIWLSLRTSPMRGWHVQQLRRIAIAGEIAETTLVYCDSDVAFLKPFDVGVFRHGGKTRLFRRDDVLAVDGFADQKVWSRNAAVALGIVPAESSTHDYISTLIAWDRDTVAGMIARMEAVHGKSWIEVIGSARRFSECMIYGRYVDDVLGGAGHFASDQEYCRVRWYGGPMTDDEFVAFVDEMEPEQVAIGVQSFSGTDVTRVRRLVER